MQNNTLCRFARKLSLLHGYRRIGARQYLNRNVAKYSTDVTSQRTVDTENFGDVFMIGINRPEKRNCVDPATGQQLIDAFNQFNEDENSLVAVLYGKGGTFCAGADLSAIVAGDFHEAGRRMIESGHGMLGPSRMWFKKPVIAAISGYAVAGGLELALMCDLRVVEESAIMGIFNRRFDVPLIDGGTVRLPHLIGLSRALDLILTGRHVTGKEALDMGLANRLVSTGTALGQAMQLAKNIAKFPQASLLADRRCAYDNTYSSTSLEDAFKHEFETSLPNVDDQVVKGAQNFVDGQGRHGSFSKWTAEDDDPDTAGCGKSDGS